MKDTFKLIASLGLICLFASAALVYVHNMVEEPCRAAEQAALNENLKLVMPSSAVNMEKMELSSPSDVVFFSGRDASGKVVGYAAESIGNGGFSGDIKVMVGLTPEGKITGVMVTSHSETPGVGSKATDRKVTKSFWDVMRGRKEEQGVPPNVYLDSFAGKAVDKLNSSVPLQSAGLKPVSGATYSSNAVYNAVNKIADAFPGVSAKLAGGN